MPPYKKQSSVQRKSQQEQAISLVLSGARNLIVPLFNAEYVYLNHPLSAKTIHVKVLSPLWDELMTDLNQHGLLPRIAEELDILSEVNVDAAKWKSISATFRSKYAIETALVKDTPAVSQ